MDENSFSLMLGREELVTVVALLGARGLPGLGENLFDGWGEDEIRTRISAGMNSLRARGLVQETIDGSRQKHEIQIEGALLALVGTCLRAPKVLFLNRVPLGGPFLPWYVHLGVNITVIHRQVQSGVHELFACSTLDKVMDELSCFLELDQIISPDGEATYDVPKAVYDQAVHAAQNGDFAASAQALGRSGMPVRVAEDLTHALGQVEANTVVTLMRLQPVDGHFAAQPVDMLVLLQAPGQLWSVRTADEPVMTLSSLSHAQASGLLRALVDR